MKNIKKILIAVAVVVVIAILLFVKDPETQKIEAMTSIYNNILLKNADTAVKTCGTFETALKDDKISPAQLHQNFADLVRSWKMVQATYIIGEYDDDLKDTPLFIDNFHTGKGDFFAQMEHAIHSDASPAEALYKTSYQTINALGYILFADQKNPLTPHRLDMARYVVDSICDNLKTVAQAYHDHKKDIINDPKTALGNFMNTLSNQTFMLKDWRIGDPAGLTIKFKDVGPSASRLEYPFSHLSTVSMQTILHAQAELLAPQNYKNLSDLIELFGATKQLSHTQVLLKQAVDATDKLHQDDQILGADIKPVYHHVDALQKDYYNVLTPALHVSQKLLEADGD